MNEKETQPLGQDERWHMLIPWLPAAGFVAAFLYLPVLLHKNDVLVTKLAEFVLPPDRLAEYEPLVGGRIGATLTGLWETGYAPQPGWRMLGIGVLLLLVFGLAGRTLLAAANRHDHHTFPAFAQRSQFRAIAAGVVLGGTLLLLSAMMYFAKLNEFFVAMNAHLGLS